MMRTLYKDQTIAFLVARMKCTWQVGYGKGGRVQMCRKPAVLHWVGQHPRTGRSTTGVARCHGHRHIPMAGDDFTALSPFFESELCAPPQPSRDGGSGAQSQEELRLREEASRFFGGAP